MKTGSSSIVVPAIFRPGTIIKETRLNGPRPEACRGGSYVAWVFFVRTLLLSCPLLFYLSPSFAADFSVSASLDRQQVALNDRAVLSLTVSGSAMDLPQPTMPPLPDFQIS